MSTGTRAVAVLLVALMTLSTVAPAVAAGGPGSAPTDGAVADQPRSISTQTPASTGDERTAPNGTNDTADDGLSHSTPLPDGGTAEITGGLADATGTVEVVVRMQEAKTAFSTSAAVTRRTLKAQAERTQASVEAFAADRQGVEVLQSFWLTNAVLLEVDTDALGERGLATIAALDGVTELHPNYEVETPEPVRRTAGSGGAAPTDVVNGYNATYGLDQVNATEVWSQYDAMGGGAKVAVLDTGVWLDHPDIELYTTDPGDPTYPGGWAEFNSEGEMVEGSEPHAAGYHGTHTSGTVSGGNASGTWIGVAPDVSLMHGMVLGPNGGTFARIVGGMQWAVSEDADVVSMSLGATGEYSQFIEPVRNAERAGTAVVASSGNDGAGISGSPGNVYESTGVGATNESLGIAEFSSGEVIQPAADFGDGVPASWPDEYVVPDVAAPGVNVLSAVPAGTFPQSPDAVYGYAGGTSMAAPHVAGAMALLESVSGEDLTPAQLQEALEKSAWKPANCSPSCDPREGKDTRYGTGIIDVGDAVTYVAGDTGVTGTVTNDTRVVEDARVVRENGFADRTGGSGEYTLYGKAGTYNLTVSAFGFESTSASVAVTEGNMTTQNFTLADKLELELVDGQKRDVHAGDDTVSVTVRAAHADSITVEQLGNVSTANASLQVDGEAATFGQPVSLGGGIGEVTVTVETDAQASGTVELRHTFQGAGATKSLTSGTSHVYTDPVSVAVLNTEDRLFGTELDSTLDQQLPPRYEVAEITPSDIDEFCFGGCEGDEERVDDEAVQQYDTIVVQNLSANAEFNEEFAADTSTVEVGVVYLDNFGASNGVYRLSQATGDPAKVLGETDSRQSVVTYRVEQDSPIFDGVAQEGEYVNLYTSPSYRFLGTGLHTYYQNYEGAINGQTLATVDATLGYGSDYSFETPGGGLGVDRFRNTVLATALGRTTPAQGPQFTDAANQILANAVAFASTTPPVTPENDQPRRIDTGGSVSVTIDATDSHAIEELTVNTAESSTIDESDLSLHVDGKVAAFGQTLAYDGAQSVTVEVSVDENVTGTVSLETAVTASDSEGDVETVSVGTGPTSVYNPPVNVPSDADGLVEAMNLVVAGGDVVLADGTYQPSDESPLSDYSASLYVDKPNITVRGADGATPTLAYPSFAFSHALVYTDYPGLTLENLQVGVNEDGTPKSDYSFSSYGLLARNTRDVTVRNVTVGGGRGLGLTGTENVDVVNTTATGVYSGVAVGSVASSLRVQTNDTRIANSTIATSSTLGGAVDIGLLSSNVTVTGSVLDLSETSTSSAGYGVKMSTADDVLVADNRLSADTASGVGVYADFSDRVVVRNNNFAFADGAGPSTGVLVDGSEYTTQRVVNNTIRNADRGVDIVEGTNATVMLNDIEATKGIVVSHLPLTEGPIENTGLNDVRFNDIEAETGVYVTRPVAGETIDARLNHFEGVQNFTGGPGAESVVYDPFMTSSPVEMADEKSVAELYNTTHVATDLTLEANTSYALGVPGPEAGTIGEILGEFQGVVYTYETGDGWQLAHGDDRVDPLDAMLVVPTQDTRVTLEFRGQTPTAVNRHSLEKGLNFVAAPSYERAEDAFGFTNTEVTGIFHQFAEPNSQLGPTGELDGNYPFTGVEGTGPNVSAMTGYFVLAEGDGTLVGSLQANPDMQELYGQLDANGTVNTAEPSRPALAQMTASEIVERFENASVRAEVTRQAVLDDLRDAVAEADGRAAAFDAIESASTAFTDGVSLDEHAGIAQGVQRAVRQVLSEEFGTDTHSNAGNESATGTPGAVGAAALAA